MNVNMYLIDKWIRKRKEQKLYEIKPIGSAIRLRRKAMKMTLEQGADGICSISYLSKIENNLIAVSEQFLEKLLVRFQMKELPVTDDVHYQNHLRMMIKELIHGELPSLELLKDYEHREDYQSYLIGFVIYTMHHQVELRNRCFDQLKIFIPNMSHHELALTLIVLGLYFIENERYQDASNCVRMAPEDGLLTIELNMLLRKIYLIASLKMHRFIDVINHMNAFMQQAMHLHYYRLMGEVKSEFYTFCALYADPIHMSDMMQAMSSITKYDKDYIIALTHFGQHDHEQVIKLAFSYRTQSADWMILYLMALDYLGLKDKLIHEIAHFPEQLPLTDGLKRVRTHLYYKHHHDKGETLGYLRREILGIKALPDNYLISEFLMIDSMSLFSKHQHYKESTHVFTKFTHHLRELKMARYRFTNED